MIADAFEARGDLGGVVELSMSVDWNSHTIVATIALEP